MLMHCSHIAINKVRKVVKMFKRSLTKNNDTLQPYVKRAFGKEPSLILDCRTRLSSLVDMLARFLQLCGPVQKALLDLGQANELTDADFTAIIAIVSCLEALKVAVNALCRRNTNLISAQAALQFCIIQLQKQNSELARTLEVLEGRVILAYTLPSCSICESSNHRRLWNTWQGGYQEIHMSPGGSSGNCLEDDESDKSTAGAVATT